jgi:hypothetical protein
MFTLLLRVHLVVLGNVILTDRDFTITFDEFSECNITLAAELWIGIRMVYEEYFILRSFRFRTDMDRSHLVAHTPDLVLRDVGHSWAEGMYTECYIYDRLDLAPAASAPRG